MGVPQNEWFVTGNPIKMDDLGVPPFQEIPIYGGFLKWGYRQIIHFHRFSIVNHSFWGTPLFREPPYLLHIMLYTYLYYIIYTNTI